MARKIGTGRFHSARHVAHLALQNVEQRVAEILGRQEIDTRFRRNAEEQDERSANAEELAEQFEIQRRSSQGVTR